MLSVRPLNLFTPRAYVWVMPPGWQKAVRAMTNNMYYESLEAKAKQWYREKLSCMGLSIQDDPYLLTNNGRFVSDMTTWPRIEFGDIFGYFITRPGVYIQQQLLSWKQLYAFNYFQAGYLRTMSSFSFSHAGKRLVMLKAKVNGGQQRRRNGGGSRG